MKWFCLLALGGLLTPAPAADPARDHLEKAYAALRRGDNFAAVAQLELAAESHPENVTVAKELAYALLRAGRPKDALLALDRALALDPRDERIALQHAYTQQQNGGSADAASAFEKLANAADADVRRLARQALSSSGGTGARAYGPLQDAFQALAERRYDEALAAFHRAAALAPERADIQKEIAYASLTTGQNQLAIEAFERARELEPFGDFTALELAFLLFEDGERPRALALFRELRNSSRDDVRATAVETSGRIERDLAESIERWKASLAQDLLNRSAHLELARLYEENLEPDLAADRYLAAWVLPQRPRPDEILLKLASVRSWAGDEPGARGAWLLASYSKETRVAEQAREKLGKRFPYAAEFRRALDLDPGRTTLRRDLAYLLLEVNWVDEAQKEFEQVVADDPNDLLATAQLAYLYLQSKRTAEAVVLLERSRSASDPNLAAGVGEALRKARASQAQPHKSLGERSLQLSYLRDARDQLQRAHDLDPNDHTVALKLGVVQNLLKNDREAIRWFRLAGESPDPEVAAQARASERNLAPLFKRFSTTVWTYPFFSTRFRSAFNYSQWKTEMRLGSAPVLPYLSLRFAGDVRGASGGAAPQSLSESALIAGLGLRTPTRHGVTLWGEAGEALTYLRQRPEEVPAAGPDFRGGLNWFRGWGPTLATPTSGRFAEVNLDAVFLSRFDNSALIYWQARPGYRLPIRGGWNAQVFLNMNVTSGSSREYWANFAEAGPGIKLRVPGVDPPMDFSVSFLRGAHLRHRANPRGPNYFDLRVGLWYSFAK